MGGQVLDIKGQGGHRASLDTYKPNFYAID